MKVKDTFIKVSSQIDKIVKNIASEERLKSQSKALADFAKEIKQELKLLDENAEFDKLTAVFYGQTNAGKSTLIEALRLLLKEKTKLKEQELFKAEFKKEDRLIKLEDEIKAKELDFKEKKELLQNDFASFKAELDEGAKSPFAKEAKTHIMGFEAKKLWFEAKENALNQEEQSLEKDINHKKELLKAYEDAASQAFKDYEEHLGKRYSKLAFILFGWVLVNNAKKLKNELLAKNAELEKHLSSFIKEQREEFAKIKAKQKAEEDENKKALEALKDDVKLQDFLLKWHEGLYKKECKRLETLRIRFEKEKDANTKILEANADGSPIGDGRADFTRSNAIYEFDNFKLIDTPGIEGREENVREAIEIAVRKAHLVFYVLREPKLEGSNNNEKKDIFLKLVGDLGGHSELYALYNQPINSPRELKKELVSKGDLEALKIDVDQKMEEIASKGAYKGHLALSARPAFLSLASCLIEESKNAKDKEKFVSKLSEEELLEKSRLKDLAKILTSINKKDVIKKIELSAKTKISTIIKKVCEQIEIAIKESYNPWIEEATQSLQASYKSLDLQARSSKQQLELNILSAIDELSSDAADDMYWRIDMQDLGNDACKSMIKKDTRALNRNFKEACEEYIQEQNDFIIKSFEGIAAELAKDLEGFAAEYVAPSFKIDIDSGVNGWGVLASGAGLGVAIAMSAGTVLIAIAVVGVVWAAITAAIGFLTKNLKNPSKEKSVDDTIEKNKEALEDAARKMLQNYSHELDKSIQKAKEILKQNSLDTIVKSRDMLVEARKKLIDFDKNL